MTPLTVILFYICLGYVLCQENATEYTTISSKLRAAYISSVLPPPVKPFPSGIPNWYTSSSSSEISTSEEIVSSTTTESLETVSSTELPETTTIMTASDSSSSARPQLSLLSFPPTPTSIPNRKHTSNIDQNQVSTQSPLPTPPPKPPSRPTRPIYRPPTRPTYKPTLALLYNINLQDEEGGYLIDFLAANSVYRMEKGYFKDDPNDEKHKILVKTGAYGFTSPEGVHFHVDFIADENGFRSYESRPTQ